MLLVVGGEVVMMSVTEGNHEIARVLRILKRGNEGICPNYVMYSISVLRF